MEHEPCAFAHSCCNPGPRERVRGTDLFYCIPHLHVMSLQQTGDSAGEMAGTRTNFVAPRSNRSWSLGVQTAGAWI
jgi:hypothetical protein